MQGSLLYDVKVYLAHNQKCHVFSQELASVKVQEVDTLNCIHEEADTRIYLHAAFQSEQALEAFTCKLYAQHNDSHVNIARYNLFRLARRSEALYKRSLQETPHVPSPVGNGWITEDGALLINWMDLPPAPDCIMELVNCSSTCKKGHNNCSDSKTCTCLQNKLSCTDLCKCEGRHCKNTCGPTLSDDELENEDIEEE
ncbi:hypothetical protein BSL78_19365 [Apostichopus japonicus]|uniref:Tesmin/TSO1-like CXC domain-containing protein n=1 Tax=Stichopus japonicus TaxID=307972 RepID=A0A2G8K714_STIJA|nr:hypothetical protein BSL78_19365 [Apostichopus japonicus]